MGGVLILVSASHEAVRPARAHEPDAPA
jgi:hypothetical protein